MKTPYRFYIGFFLFIGITACSPQSGAIQPTTVPTVNSTVLVEQTLNTVEIQTTSEALNHPSPTATLTSRPTSTSTSLPTTTPIPTTQTAGPAKTDTPVVIKTSTLPGPTATEVPAAERTALALGESAKFLYAGTYGTGGGNEFTPNQHFGLALGFQNTGSVAWNGGYKVMLVYSAGEFTGQPEIFLDGVVQPGEKTEVNLWGFGSEQLGLHSWVYRLFDPQGRPVPGGLAVFYYTSS